ncbi:MAG: transketolase, partial [Elusimicrobia bacterium CG11_big_fil_rev_8_21_14_0_20_64_6]
MKNEDLDALSVATIRTLSIDAVQAAKSGHPGTPMAMAPLAYALWQKVLRFDPQAPLWPGRDRFVLSIGHASALLYSVLHLAGVKSVGPEGEALETPAVSLDDLKRFRQLDSRCPGHPEHGLTAGVEMTTGPLGQGVATSVGMAAGELWKAKTFNRPGYELFSAMVYALCGDGDMMEGVSSEAASLAGHLKLSNLCWIYDSNHITIEGATSLAFSEETAARFLAYGWSVARVADANDLAALERALRAARQSCDRPTLIVVDSHIGWGSPHKQDTSAAHGEPLGDEEIRLVKRFYGWPEDAHFLVPDGVLEHFAKGIGERGRAARAAWETNFAEYRMEHPELADSLDRMTRRELPPGWDAGLPVFAADAKGLAGREAFAKVLDAAGKGIPWLVGGAADLAPST